MGINLASKFSSQVDERFTRESQAMLALNNDYEFTGVDTVKVYSIPVVAMTDYTRSGSSRYGTATDLTRNVQTMQITKDRAFNFIIDKGDKIQSQMVMDAGRALARQTSEVIVPEYDSYVFAKLAEAAIEVGNTDSTAMTTSNAYEYFLKASEVLGNNNVPEKGRICFCSYRYANLLKQDDAFMKYGDSSQQMLVKGVIGEVDGCRIVKVPSGRLPAGASFIMTHPVAATAPKQLEDYKIHDNPPGINGWLVEGRIIYDAFVLNEKSKAIYYQGGAGAMYALNFMTAASASGKSTVILVNPTVKAASSNKWYYCTATTASGLQAATFGSAITTANWTELTALSTEITPSSGHKFIRVVEVDSANKPIGVGTGKLNIG